jgi:hypothetical protein
MQALVRVIHSSNQPSLPQVFKKKGVDFRGRINHHMHDRSTNGKVAQACTPRAKIGAVLLN